MASVDSLKVFAIAGHTDSAGTAVADVDQEELRMPIGAVLRPGYLTNMLDLSANPNAFRVRQDTGANMNVKVGNAVTAKIDGYVLRGTVAGQGSYILRLETSTVTVAVPATDATNPARYGVYAWINDTAYSGTAARAYQGISCIRGTPAGSPTTPGPLAVWSAYVLLWEFQLPANATAVTNTILDSATAFDRRAPSGRAGCHVGRLSTVQVIGSGSLTGVTFDTDVFDPDGFSTGATFTLVTVPAGLAGVYAVEVALLWSANSAVSQAVVTLNGTDNSIGTQQVSQVNLEFSAILELAVGDTLGVKVLQGSGGNLNLLARLKLWRMMV